MNLGESPNGCKFKCSLLDLRWLTAANPPNKAMQRTVDQSRYCYDAIPQNGLDSRPLIADVGQTRMTRGT